MKKRNWLLCAAYMIAYVGIICLRRFEPVVPRAFVLVPLAVAFGLLLFARGSIGKAPTDLLAVLVAMSSMASFRQVALAVALDAASLAWIVYFFVKRRRSEPYVSDRRVVVGFSAATIALFAIDLALGG